MVVKCRSCNITAGEAAAIQYPFLGQPSSGDDSKTMSKMLEIHAHGSPYEIGVIHGREARLQISRSIDFYAGMFKQTSKLEWPEVRRTAEKFGPNIEQKWPNYYEEIRGVADGAEVELADILALNVRTEIAFGLFSDGCTSMSWRTQSHSYLAQNWDWMEEQKENLILLTIDQTDKPSIKMVTEAGLIGKIGMNSAGVGVLLNAIKAKGMDATKLPCHLGLRMVLDSRTREEAVQRLENFGVASSCHMLVADKTGGMGLEWSHLGVEKVVMNGKDQVFHSNHYLIPHKDVEDTNWLEDSNFRVTQIEELCKRIPGEPAPDEVFEIFKDETNYPNSICRRQILNSTAGSLFNIVMDLEAKTALVTLGRPIAPDWQTKVAF